MNNAEILKAIKLLDERKIDEATCFLKQQILKSENKSSYNLTSLVKKIIEDKELARTRPQLAQINFTKDNKQFVCNGLVLLKWLEHETALDVLPQMEKDAQTINTDAVLRHDLPRYELTENDIAIINNCDKILQYAKANKRDCILNLFGKFFDLKVIATTIKIIQSYNKDFSVFANEEKNSFAQLETTKIVACICPIRCVEEESEKKFNDFTNEVLQILKNN